MMMDIQLEKYLKQRRFEPPSSNLAERIIAAARMQYPQRNVLEYVADILGAVLPRPAYALAFVLALGVAIGTSLPVQELPDNFTLTADEGTVL
jgi:hypothetical protein